VADVATAELAELELVNFLTSHTTHHMPMMETS